MRTAGDRLITPLMVLSLIFLVAGLHSLARSSPEAGKKDPGTQTQTRPAQGQPEGTPQPKAAPSEAKGAENTDGGHRTGKATQNKKSGEVGKSRTSTPRDDKPLVFTDEDLKKFHDGSSPSAARPAPPAPPSGDPLKALKDQQERARWRQEKIVKMQQRILDLEGKLKALEQKRLSVVNPYVPRPQEGEDEKAEEKGKSGPELLAQTQAEIKETTEELETARKDLDTFLQTTPE